MPRNLFLYLTLVCFFALIAIFIVDGYLGIYDTLYVTAGEREGKVEPDFWQRQGYATPEGIKTAYNLSARWDEKAFFRYEIDNRRFSGYTSNVEVSLWRSQEKVRDVLNQPLSVDSFGSGNLEWVIDSNTLKPAGTTPEQTLEFSIIIKRGEIERRVILSFYPVYYPPKAEIVPVAPAVR